ncbi:glycosyltransferase family 2 protein [Vibrio algicola]|uniref:Glycosyltransferase n=1 Tax=Vibrio algicola TaxID=2662262 RepID=A0A5Q0TAR7_9VIBR|nr:glycosyltransferase family 2 protein [Vibrio algicola]
MPAYNSSKHIAVAIESVINQSYSDWELIVIDDCSTDSTILIVDKYSHQDSRVRCHSTNVNAGAGVARNIGIELASGQFLAFLDSDDLWDSNKLTKQLGFMKANNAEISHTSFSFIDEDGFSRPGSVSVSKCVNLETNLRKTEIGTSTAIINRRLVLDSIKFSEIRARQDLKLWIDLLKQGYKSYGLDSDLVKYRIRSGSVSSNKIKMLFVTLKVYLEVKELSVMKRISCYLSYVFNAIRKRQ